MKITSTKRGYPVTKVCLGLGFAAMQLITCANSVFAQSPATRGATQMPYTRYEADVATLTSSQVLQTTNFDIKTTASEASQQKFVNLPNVGSAVEWTVSTPGNGVTMRYTMPDSADGKGLNGEVDVFVNGVLDQTVAVTSRWAWQYFLHKEPENTPVPFTGSDYIAMRFDETHFLLNRTLNVGDKIRIQKKTNDGLAYGIDFIELEPVAAPLPKPAGYVSIADFGAAPNDTVSDLAAFNSALAAAGSAGTGVYLPPGKWDFNNKVVLTTSNIGIKGAGMWHTQVYYSNPNQFSGGILARATNVEVSDIYFGTVNTQRLCRDVPCPIGGIYMIYKAFMGTWGNNSKFTRVWAEHFEVAAWLGGYDAPLPVDVTNGLVISQARFRNNYADGVNFSQGTMNSVVEQSNIRNSGDDGLAMWPSNSPAVPEEVNNIFRFSTVEHVFRAGGIAIFGGKDHQVHNMLIRDCFGGAAIRFTTDFSGYTFSSSGLYRIHDIDIYNCGTSYDLWHQKRGAIEFNTPLGVTNMQFDNIYIKNSQRHGVQLDGGNYSNITFNNIVIDGTGLDASTRNVQANSYGGVGIYSDANSGTATFNNASISNFEDAATVNQKPSFNLVVRTGAVPLQGIAFPSNQIAMANGDTQGVAVSFNPAQATNKTVTFTSSNPSVVVVTSGTSGSATLQALKVGTSVITATAADGGFKSTTTVTVTPAVSIAVVGDSAVEGGADGSVRISAPQIASAITVNYTISGTAANSRYISAPSLSGTVTLDPTRTEQVINITAINDTIFQGNQTLTITLGAGAGYELSKANTATVSIVDNETPVCTAPVVGYGASVPVVDGQASDAVWAKVPSSTISNVTFGSGTPGLSGKWRATSTPDRLYVLVEVVDPNLFNDSAANWWEDDVVELFIDGDNSKKTTYDNANDFQLGFRWNDTAIKVGGASVPNTTGVVQSQFRTSNGYNIEVSIPWSTINVVPKVGSKIGFDVAIDDDANGGARDSQLTSISTTGTNWNNTSAFGSLWLTSCGDVLPSSSSSSSMAPSSKSASSASVIPGSSKSSSSVFVPGSSKSSSSSIVGSSAKSSSSVPVSRFNITNRWKNTFLCDTGATVTYSATSTGAACQWVTESVAGGFVEIRNLGTGDYMHIENLTGTVQATARMTVWDSSKWQLEVVDGTYSRFRNKWQSTQYIHVENQTGSAQYGGIDSSWWSAQWQIGGTTSVASSVAPSSSSVASSIKSSVASSKVASVASSAKSSVASSIVASVAGSAKSSVIGISSNSRSSTALPVRGYAAPWTEYQLEAGRLGGGAKVLAPSRTKWDKNFIQAEAIGRSAVVLNNTGDSVAVTNTKAANSVVLRFSIPDSASGGGLDATLGLYINGTRVKSLVLTSKYSWSYKGGLIGDPIMDIPAEQPHTFFDEVAVLLDQPIPVGAEVKLQRDSQDTAAFYVVDLIDLEQVAPPLTMPAGFTDVTTLGIVPNSGIDYADKISSVMNGGAKLWFPPGEYLALKLNSGNAGMDNKGAEIRGAGMWYTTIKGPKSIFFCIGHVKCVFGDFSIRGESKARAEETQGVQKAFAGPMGNGSLIENMWIEHVVGAIWVGNDPPFQTQPTDNLTIRHVRIRNTYADGVNLDNGTSNSVVENSHFRNTGDDAAVVWSIRWTHWVRDKTVNAGPTFIKEEAKNAPDQGIGHDNIFRNLTVQMPWRANCYAAYGGFNNTFENLMCEDVLTYPGILIANEFSSYPFGPQLTTFKNITLLRAGGPMFFENANVWKHGALKFYLREGDVNDILVENVDIIEPLYSGIEFRGFGTAFIPPGEKFSAEVIAGANAAVLRNVTLRNINIVNAGTFGIEVQDGGGRGQVNFEGVKVSGSALGPIEHGGAPSSFFNKTAGNVGW